MNFNSLKAAWKQYCLVNAMQHVDEEEILAIITLAQKETTRKIPRLMTSAIVFVILTFCCQAG